MYYVKALDNFSQMRNLLAKATDQNIRKSLIVCVDQYGEAVRSIAQSVNSLQLKFYLDAQDLLGRAVNDADTCESSFGDLSLQSPLTARNNAFIHFGGISMDVIVYIRKHV